MSEQRHNDCSSPALPPGLPQRPSCPEIPPAADRAAELRAADQLDIGKAALLGFVLILQRKAVKIRRGRATVTGNERSEGSHWGTGKA